MMLHREENLLKQYIRKTDTICLQTEPTRMTRPVKQQKIRDSILLFLQKETAKSHGIMIKSFIKSVMRLNVTF